MSAASEDGAVSEIWALADDRAGNRTQVIGVAEAMRRPFAVKDISYGPFGRLPNTLLGRSDIGAHPESRAGLRGPWPRIVIAAGRRTGPIARAIKRRSGAKAFLVQVMDPGAGLGDFDLVAIPRHDRPPRRSNVVAVTGAPHRVSPEALAAARETWAPHFAALPRPRVALLVGGTTKRRAFSADDARSLARTASELAGGAGGSLLVSTSRRTGAAADPLVAAVTVPHFAYRWGDAGENPYLGYLALADAVVVTGDSVSMCCEACATTAPVYVHAPPGTAIDKHVRLHRELFERGFARPMGEPLQAWSHPPLNAAFDIAAEIARRLDLR